MNTYLIRVIEDSRGRYNVEVQAKSYYTDDAGDLIFKNEYAHTVAQFKRDNWVYVKQIVEER